MSVCRFAVSWSGLLAGVLLALVPGRLPADDYLGQPPCFEPPPYSLGPQAGVMPPAPAAGDPSVPIVRIHVRVPEQIAAGQEIVYHLQVSNPSQAKAYHVLVRDALPANARFVRAQPEPATREPELTWHLGTLDGGASKEIVLVLMPTGGGDVDNCARVQFEHGQCVTTRLARPTLSVRKTGPSQATLHEVLRYQITVTNTGPVPIKDIILTDYLPEGFEHTGSGRSLIWPIERLDPGRSHTVEYQVVARRLGRLCNRVTAAAGGGVLGEHESCVTVTEPRLKIEQYGPRTGYVNVPAVYQITVSNLGTAALANVSVVEKLPAETTFVSASAGGTAAGGQVQWFLGTLQPGTSRTVDVVVRARATSRLCMQATATTDRGLRDQHELCTEFAGTSALLLEVVDTVDPVPVGGTTSYVITVRNQGTVPATSVQIVATLPKEMALILADGPTHNRPEGQLIYFEPWTLPPGGEARYKIDVKALQAGDVRFHVELTATQLPAGPVRRQESTTIYANLPAARKLDG